MKKLVDDCNAKKACSSYKVLLQNKTSYCMLKFQSMQGTGSMVQSLWIRSWELAWTAAAASSHKLLSPWSKAPSIPWLMPKRIGNIAVFKDSPTFRGSSSLHLTQDLAVPPAGKSKLRTQTNPYLLFTIYANSWFTRPEEQTLWHTVIHNSVDTNIFANISCLCKYVTETHC
jgi:hypothetical protein